MSKSITSLQHEYSSLSNELASTKTVVFNILKDTGELKTDMRKLKDEVCFIKVNLARTETKFIREIADKFVESST